MKLSGTALDRFLRSPDGSIRVVLLYGPDHGLIAERAHNLEKVHLGENPGPFSQNILTQTELKSDPASLQDSFCALSLGGGARTVRLKTSGDQSAKTIKALLDALSAGQIIPAALLLIEGGDLGPRSSLRKAIEQDKGHAVSIPCYAPNLGDLRNLAEELARTNELGFANSALDYLVSRLPQDRALARSEVEKLMLYAMKNHGGTIEIDDISTIVTDFPGSGFDALSFAVASGSRQDADQHLINALDAGQSPIGILRALQRHFLRLSAARAAIDGGRDAKSAMATLRPPVFFASQQKFSRQLALWSSPKLVQACAHCLSTERAMKRSGAVPGNLLARLIIKLGSAPNVAPRA